MRLNIEKYDNWLSNHKKIIIIVWVSIFFVSIPFASYFFSVVSYNITGNSISNGSTASANSADNTIALIVQNNNIYSNLSKTFFTKLSLEFPSANVTSLYSIENASLYKIYGIIYSYSVNAETYYLKLGAGKPLNNTILTDIAYKLFNNLSVSIPLLSHGELLPGASLFSFVNGVIRGYENSTPANIYNNYIFTDYPITLSNATLAQFVNSAHNTSIAIMRVSNYSNASAAITSLAANYGQSVFIAGASPLENSLEASTLSGTLIAILAGILIAILITGFIFKSPIAAFMPLVMFIIDLVIAYSLFYIIFHFILDSSISFFDPVLTSILMLGLCTDYIIYILYRYKQEKLLGKTQKRSASLALGWAGTAVLVSGLTVISAYTVLAFFNLPFIGGSGILNALGIGVVLSSALTFLPALLHLAGDKFVSSKHNNSTVAGRIFDKIGEFDRRNAGKLIAIFIILSVIFFYIFITITPGFNILGLLPSSQTKSAFYSAENSFGYDVINPISLVFLNSSMSTTRISTLINNIKSIPGIHYVFPSDGSGTSYNIYLNSLAFSRPAIYTYNNLVAYLTATGQPYSLGGVTTFLAGSYNAISGDIFPLITILGIVIFAILFIILFSLITPLRLVLLLIAILAIANAATIFIFYVLLSLPFIIFAQVFLITNIMGVGVDYDIFLVMRIREHVKKGETNIKAVKSGLSRSGPIILSLGAILASVFFGLAASGIPLIAEIGFMVGIGILLDTFLSILFIIPSFMFLLSRYNWWPSTIK
jgi:RND superfamily putative drug exporter